MTHISVDKGDDSGVKEMKQRKEKDIRLKWQKREDTQTRIENLPENILEENEWDTTRTRRSQNKGWDNQSNRYPMMSRWENLPLSLLRQFQDPGYQMREKQKGSYWDWFYEKGTIA